MTPAFKSRTVPPFWSHYSSLPAAAQRSARVAYRLFAVDPSHPGLRFKKVHPRRPIYSARVGLNYRAVCILEDDTAFWFWIGNHGDYDRMIGGLR